MVLARQEIGEVLRTVRLRKGHTLRQVAGRASVALGYLSEIERGQKEASSEILASVADALDTPLSSIYHEVGDRLAVNERFTVDRDRFDTVVPGDVFRDDVPDTVPDDILSTPRAPIASR